MNEIVMINITGKDSKGLLALFAGILSRYDVNILDIGQAVIHEYLSLGILVEIPEMHQSSPVLKDLLFEGHKLGLSVNFKQVDLKKYDNWVLASGKERRIITLLGRKLTAEQIGKVAEVITGHGLNIRVITRLSGRIPMGKQEKNPRASVQLSVSGKPEDVKKMRTQLMEISKISGIDISFHLDDIYRKNRKLVVFDMDSTLIQAEVIDELAKIANAGDKVAEITNSAMNGEIDFTESLKRRVALLKGLKEDQILGILGDLPLSEGAARVTGILKRLGYKIGILSGGFRFVGDYLKEKLDLDYVYANELEIENGYATGRISGEIIDGEKKAGLLKMLAARENIKLEQTIAVGDGANDLAMIAIAGLGVAFHAKPIVRERADNAITKIGLDGLLYLLGIREREIPE